MRSSVLLRHTRDRLNSLHQLVEPSQIERFPLTAEDYEDLVNLVLGFPDSFRRAVDTEFRRLFTERSRSVSELQQVRCELANMADRYTAIVQSVEQDAALRTLAGQHQLFRNKLAKLSDAVTTLQRDKARVLADWPVCDDAEFAQASVEREQGRSVHVDEAFAQMRGMSIEELHQRWEAHKAKRKEYGWE
jgi:hypothetical protein